MKTFMLYSAGGPLVILTSHPDIKTPKLLHLLAAKGIDRFIAREIPTDLARMRYGTHFDVVANDLHETDDLRVLDYNGNRAFHLFSFGELGEAEFYEPDSRIRAA